MNGLVSYPTSCVIPGGKSLLIRSICAFTASAVSMALASGRMKMASPTVGLSSNRLATSCDFAPSSTRATSFSLTNWPSGPALDDHLLELADLDQPADGGEGVLVRLPGAAGRLADLPGGERQVLLPQGGDHVGRRQAADGQLLRVQPHPQGVVPLAEDGHVADARQPLELLLQLQHRVVAQVAAGRTARWESPAPAAT